MSNLIISAHASSSGSASMIYSRVLVLLLCNDFNEIPDLIDYELLSYYGWD